LRKTWKWEPNARRDAPRMLTGKKRKRLSSLGYKRRLKKRGGRPTLIRCSKAGGKKKNHDVETGWTQHEIWRKKLKKNRTRSRKGPCWGALSNQQRRLASAGGAEKKGRQKGKVSLDSRKGGGPTHTGTELVCVRKYDRILSQTTNLIREIKKAYGVQPPVPSLGRQDRHRGLHFPGLTDIRRLFVIT